MEHEQELQTALTKLRTANLELGDSPDQIDQYNDQVEALNRQLIARSEAHPELKASTLVAEFMEQVETTENYLSLLRNGYNDTVELYNTQIHSFPDLLLAKAFEFEEKTLFRR